MGEDKVYDIAKFNNTPLNLFWRKAPAILSDIKALAKYDSERKADETNKTIKVKQSKETKKSKIDREDEEAIDASEATVYRNCYLESERVLNEINFLLDTFDNPNAEMESVEFKEAYKNLSGMLSTFYENTVPKVRADRHYAMDFFKAMTSTVTDDRIISNPMMHVSFEGLSNCWTRVLNNYESKVRECLVDVEFYLKGHKISEQVEVKRKLNILDTSDYPDELVRKLTRKERKVYDYLREKNYPMVYLDIKDAIHVSEGTIRNLKNKCPERFEDIPQGQLLKSKYRK